MSPADRLAYRVKMQPMRSEASAIIIGKEEAKTIIANPEPCDPPDYQPGAPSTFCGLPMVIVPEQSRFAFVIDIPTLDKLKIT